MYKPKRKSDQILSDWGQCSTPPAPWWYGRQDSQWQLDGRWTSHFIHLILFAFMCDLNNSFNFGPFVIVLIIWIWTFVVFKRIIVLYDVKTLIRLIYIAALFKLYFWIFRNILSITWILFWNSWTFSWLWEQFLKSMNNFFKI